MVVVLWHGWCRRLWSRRRAGSAGCSCREAADGVDEVLDAGETAAADGLAGDDAEEDFDHVQPGPASRGEVQGAARVALEPGADGGMFVRGVVVADEV